MGQISTVKRSILQLMFQALALCHFVLMKSYFACEHGTVFFLVVLWKVMPKLTLIHSRLEMPRTN